VKDREKHSKIKSRVCGESLKFLCDQMVAKLGKWLRAAGYDTKIVPPLESDEKALQCAQRENRHLLTRDRHFLTIKSQEGQVFFLSGESLEEWVQELNQKLKLNWLYQPFSRCLECNAIFVEPSRQEILNQVPLDIQSLSTQFWYCPQCQKVFWEGSHTKSMLKQLDFWQNTQ